MRCGAHRLGRFRRQKRTRRGVDAESIPTRVDAVSRSAPSSSTDLTSPDREPQCHCPLAFRKLNGLFRASIPCEAVRAPQRFVQRTKNDATSASESDTPSCEAVGHVRNWCSGRGVVYAVPCRHAAMVSVELWPQREPRASWSRTCTVVHGRASPLTVRLIRLNGNSALAAWLDENTFITADHDHRTVGERLRVDVRGEIVAYAVPCGHAAMVAVEPHRPAMVASVGARARSMLAIGAARWCRRATRERRDPLQWEHEPQRDLRGNSQERTSMLERRPFG